MTKELLQKAKRLDGDINVAEYWKAQAERIPSVTFLKIVEREPNGNEHTLAELEKGDPLREVISSELVKRYEEKIKTLKTEFNNL